MNFQRSLDYLNSFFNLEKIFLNSKNRDLNLDRMAFLIKLFDRPDEFFLPIIIAGTKGKGSTGFFLEQILKNSSVSVGFYNSPHLITPLERIRINGRQVEKKDWCLEIENIQKTLACHKLPKRLGSFTYFEITTLLAILIFKRKKVSVGIFEVGLGGRLDATNILNAKIAILTPVDYDHEAILGNTLTKIAFEKAAVIKKNADVVVSCQSGEALNVIKKQVLLQSAQMYRYGRIKKILAPKNIPSFQKMNLACAFKAASLLKKKYRIKVDLAHLGEIDLSIWKGRLEKVSTHPDIYFDVGHNPVAIRSILGSLKGDFKKYKRKVVLFSASADKNYGEMIELLGREFEEIILTNPHHMRSAAVVNMLAATKEKHARIYPIDDLAEAWKFANYLLEKNSLLLCTGSFFLIGELKKMISKRKNK